MEAQQEPQVPLCVDQRRGQAAQVWCGDRLLVGLGTENRQLIKKGRRQGGQKEKS